MVSEKLLVVLIILASSFGHCGLGIHSVQLAFGRLKSPKNMISGVTGRLVKSVSRVVKAFDSQ